MPPSTAPAVSGTWRLLRALSTRAEPLSASTSNGRSSGSSNSGNNTRQPTSRSSAASHSLTLQARPPTTTAHHIDLFASLFVILLLRFPPASYDPARRPASDFPCRLPPTPSPSWPSPLLPSSHRPLEQGIGPASSSILLHPFLAHLRRPNSHRHEYATCFFLDRAIIACAGSIHLLRILVRRTRSILTIK